jgi:anti-sigma factor RsiW
VTCREFATFLADYLAGELPDATRLTFDEHLAICENCRRYLTSYEETVKLGRRAFGDDSGDVPADVPDELVRAVLAAARGRSTS